MTEARTESLKVYTVSDLTRAVKSVLEGHFVGQVCVHGEIGEFTAHTSGHVYMTLKDQRSKLKVVYFGGARVCVNMGLQMGTEVEVGGRVTVYEPDGNYQLQAFWVRPVGVGALVQQFEMMRERLRAEGLFDADRKRPLPSMPRIVGVLTSRDGAAIKDFLNVIHRRHSGVHVRIVPVPVQGKDAAPRIAKALEYANANRICDVIVLTRGGGSLEDLWAFNEEVLARAVAASEIPVISAVGHERDFTICDFVADFRCATPSVAAEQVIAEKVRLQEQVLNAQRRLASAFMQKLAEMRRRYDICASRPCLNNPWEIVNPRRQQLDMLRQRLMAGLPQLSMGAARRLELLQSRLVSILPGRIQVYRQRFDGLQQRLKAVLPHLLEAGKQRHRFATAQLAALAPRMTQVAHERLARAQSMLSALGPKNVLERGYAIIRRENGQVVRRQEDVATGENVEAMLASDKLRLVVSTDSENE